MRNWIFLASLLSASALAGPAYKWVDKNGLVHYSDRPQEGAQEVLLSKGSGRANAGRRAVPNPQPQNSAQPTEERPYDLMEITAPAEQETLWNTGGNLDVALAMQPDLRNGHRLVLYLDGKRLDMEPSSANFVVPEVFRGMHSLQVAVVDAFDEEQVRTHPRRFMVQQTSALNPQRANRGGGGPAGN